MQTKRAKTSRHRGTNSHSWGHKKKHRGKGHIGGTGLAGSGRGGDSKKSSILSGAKRILKQISAQKGVKMKTLTGKYFGKRGFKSVGKENTRVLSISYIENNYDKLVEKKIIEKDKIDTVALGYDKVLGKGKFTRKITVICSEISASAKAQIEAAGGKVEVLNPKEPEFDEE